MVPTALAASVSEGYAEKGQSEPTSALPCLSLDGCQASKLPADATLSSRQSEIVAPSEQDS